MPEVVSPKSVEVIRMNPTPLIAQLDVTSVTSYLNDLALVYGPRIFWAIVALVVGWTVGKGLAAIVHRATREWGFAAVFRKTSIGRAILVSGYSPAEFFASLAKWTVLLIGVYEAIEILEIATLQIFLRQIVLYLPYLFSGLLIMIVGFIFADSVAEIVKQAGGENKASYHSLFGDAIRVFLYFVVLVMALAQMKIDVTILYIFAQAFAWSIAIAVAIAFGWNLKDRIRPWVDKALPGSRLDEKEQKNV